RRAGAARADRRPDRARGRALRSRRARGARRARGGGVGRLHAAAAAVATSPRARGAARVSGRATVEDAYAEVDAPPEEKRARLAELHGRLDAPPGEPMWVALADARERFPISDKALHDLVDGGLIDLDRQRYETFDELRDYCAHVAGAVGVACIGVYGAD